MTELRPEHPLNLFMRRYRYFELGDLTALANHEVEGYWAELAADLRQLDDLIAQYGERLPADAHEMAERWRCRLARKDDR